MEKGVYLTRRRGKMGVFSPRPLCSDSVISSEQVKISFRSEIWDTSDTLHSALTPDNSNKSVEDALTMTCDI
jgi:hypothetical protein